MAKSGAEVKDLIAKYEKKIALQLGETGSETPEGEHVYSREYDQFKKEYMPGHLSFYETACNWCGKNVPITPPAFMKPEKIQDNLETAHLNVTPTGVLSFAIVTGIIFGISGVIFGFFFMLLLTGEPALFLAMMGIIGAFILVLILLYIPTYIATKWRLDASNQMIISIFYMVTFMRHTSNLEGAIYFASDHLSPPLSLDFKKMLWDVEAGKFKSVKETLDRYLEGWRDYNVEYIEAMHLIEGSLYEGNESRRLGLLDKSLEVILDGTYEKMLHYAHNLKSPITMLHMLGVILPILGLVILPLIVSFMTSGATSPITLAIYIGTLYNIILPVGVYLIGLKILSTRPTGYGDSDISETNPEFKKYKNILINIGKTQIPVNPLFVSLAIGLLLVFAGFTPLILHKVINYNEYVWDIGVGPEDPQREGSPCNLDYCLLDYHESEGKLAGPYGLISGIMSLFVILGIGLGVGSYYRFRSKNVIQIRNKSKQLEEEFASALFQLGNRLGDGLPAEIAFGKVAGAMHGTVSGDFMSLVSQNITTLGMNVEKAIFDPKRGALVYYPSNLIQSSMKVLVQSAKKGPKIAAQALVNISQYIKEIHKVNERLKDLMTDIISSMESQIKFLAPAIAGIVIGITSMVTTILGKLTVLMKSIGGGTGAGAGGMGNLVNMLGDGMPTFYFQIVVGLYVIQIVYILTIIVNGIQNGSDKLSERYMIGNNLINSTIFYCLLSGGVMLLFNIVAVALLKRIGG